MDRETQGWRPSQAASCYLLAASAAVAERLRNRVELLSALDLLAGADRNTFERLAAAAEEVVLPAE